jgi:hypothetical protein
VDDEMETAFGRRSQHSLVTFFADAMDGIETFIGFGAITGDYEDSHSEHVSAASAPAVLGSLRSDQLSVGVLLA